MPSRSRTAASRSRGPARGALVGPFPRGGRFPPLHSGEPANVPGSPLNGPEGWHRVRATPSSRRFPRPPVTMAQTPPSAVAGTTGEPPFAVLVVDGNEEHQILSVAALTRSGCLVRTAASGQQALQLAMGNRFDAVVIGSKLRDATGIEVLRLLADRFPTTPMIFVVPPDGEEAALQAMRSGATSYIVKTPRYTELLPTIVEEHIHEAANRRRLAETEQTQAQALTERNTAEERR